jgi:hypothetical protein
MGLTVEYDMGWHSFTVELGSLCIATSKKRGFPTGDAQRTSFCQGNCELLEMGLANS